AITVSFVLNFTLIFVIILATFVLKEIPNKKQIITVILAFLGGVIYFYPIDVIDESKTGLLIITLAMLANTISSIYGRFINRSRLYTPLTITAISMGAGSLILLIWGILAEGFPDLEFIDVVYILWLSLLNTALAFTLWNKAMQNLQATEITIINGLMLPEITILAILFLDEYPSLLDWLGIIIITVSAFLIQFFRSSDNS
ncbi:MAG: DMT family transporter, partial [Candidatus Kariarchaeaceae archaeon]